MKKHSVLVFLLSSLCAKNYAADAGRSLSSSAGDTGEPFRLEFISAYFNTTLFDRSSKKTAIEQLLDQNTPEKPIIQTPVGKVCLFGAHIDGGISLFDPSYTKLTESDMERLEAALALSPLLAAAVYTQVNSKSGALIKMEHHGYWRVATCYHPARCYPGIQSICKEEYERTGTGE